MRLPLLPLCSILLSILKDNSEPVCTWLFHTTCVSGLYLGWAYLHENAGVNALKTHLNLKENSIAFSRLSSTFNLLKMMLLLGSTVYSLGGGDLL